MSGGKLNCRVTIGKGAARVSVHQTDFSEREVHLGGVRVQFDGHVVGGCSLVEIHVVVVELPLGEYVGGMLLGDSRIRAMGRP
jgi:hypothetical protein